VQEHSRQALVAGDAMPLEQHVRERREVAVIVTALRAAAKAMPRRGLGLPGPRNAPGR
jgi:hypothetical protein